MADVGSRILVTGANGLVGSHLAEALLARGYSPRCMVRPSSNLRHVQDLPVEWVHADMRNPDELRKACQGVDAVCHCAALTRALDEETFVQVNAQGTESLARASLEANGQAARFLYVSSQAAAGPSPGPDAVIDEGHPPSPVTWYGMSKLAGERALLEMEPDLPLTIVRPAAVYGPRDADFFAYFGLVKWGLSLRLGRGVRRLSLIYVIDLVDLIIRALESPEALGQTYFGTVHSTSYAGISGSIARAMNKKTVTIPLPEMVLTPIALWAKVQGRLTGRPPLLNGNRVTDLRQPNWLCSGEKARRELGFEPDGDMDPKIKATGDWYKDNGWL